MPAEWFTQLSRRHPDVLLIPEWENFGYWRSTAPYKDWWDGRRTPPGVQRAWPSAFSFLAADASALAEQWDDLSAAVKRGDVLFIEGWYESQSNELARQLQRSLQWADQTPPITEGDWQTLLTSDVAKDRWAGLMRLRKSIADNTLETTGRNQAIDLVLRRLNDDDWLVRREAIMAAGQLGDARMASPLAALIETHNSTLAGFAAIAMVELGDAAVEPLGALVTAPNGLVRSRAITALSKIRTPAAARPLLKILRNATRAPRIVRYLKAIENQGQPEAFEAVAAQVDQEDLSVQLAAVEALAKIHHPRVDPLLERLLKSDQAKVAQRARNGLSTRRQAADLQRRIEALEASTPPQ